MSEDTGFTMDFKDFEKKFFKLVKITFPKTARRGLFQGFNAALKDAKEETPRAPFKEGHLWGSTAKTTKVKITSNEISVSGGFNIDYAARIHEMPKEKASKTNWSLPGSGPKFLETKLVRNKRKYMEIVAKSIKRAR
jgi:hypothetical protein